LLIEGDRLVAIREHAECDATERKVTPVQVAADGVRRQKALAILDKIGKATARADIIW